MSPIGQRKRTGHIAISWRFCRLKKWRIASKLACSAVREKPLSLLKTIDDFDFSLQTSLRQPLFASYLGPDFVTEGRSLILSGKEGRGKTHLAVAIGYRAIQNGFETLCATAAELIEDLSNASKRGQLQEALLTYTRVCMEIHQMCCSTFDVCGLQTADSRCH